MKSIYGKYLKTKKNSLLFETFKKLNLIDNKKYSFKILANKEKYNLSYIKVIKSF